MSPSEVNIDENADVARPLEPVPGADPRPTGVFPHLMRTTRRVVSLRTARGLVREAKGIGTHILHYPLGFGSVPIRPHSNGNGDGRIFETPVVLLHGYFHNRSGFDFMSAELRKRGFRWVHGFNYNPLRSSVPDLAARFKRTVEDLIEVSGSERVHVAGHSLGGVIVRWYIEQLEGHKVVDRCVTIGTPHRGTYVAYAGVGPSAHDMRPGSEVVRKLEEGMRRSRPRYVNLYSDLDVLIVPFSSAVLPDRPNVHNHLIEDLGHTSMLLSPELVKQVCDHLERAEKKARLPDLRKQA